MANTSPILREGNVVPSSFNLQVPGPSPLGGSSAATGSSSVLALLIRAGNHPASSGSTPLSRASDHLFSLVDREGRSLTEAFGRLSEEEQSLLRNRFGSSLRELFSLSREADPELLAEALLHMGQNAMLRQDLAMAAVAFQLLSSPEGMEGLAIQDPVRRQALEHLQVLRGEGSVGAQLEWAGRNFVREVNNPVMIVGTGVGSLVAGGVRLRVLRGLLNARAVNFFTEGRGAYLTASSIAVGAEIPSMYLATRGVNTLLHPDAPFLDPNSAGHELLSLAILIPSLRIGSGLFTRAPSLGMLGGIYFNHWAEEQMDLRTPTDGFNRLFHSLVTFGHFQAGGGVANLFLGPGYARALTTLELQTRTARRDGRVPPRSQPPLEIEIPSLLPELALAEGHGSTGKLSIRVPPWAQWIFAMASARPRGTRGRTTTESVGRNLSSRRLLAEQLNLERWIQEHRNLRKDAFFLAVLQTKLRIQNETGGTLSIRQFVTALQQKGLTQIKNSTVGEGLLKEGNDLEFVYRRWDRWGPIFHNLAQMPRNGRHQGWTRLQYAQEHLKRGEEGSYHDSNLGSYIRWGVFLWHHAKELGLTRPKGPEIPLNPNIDFASVVNRNELVRELKSMGFDQAILHLLRLKPKLKSELGYEVGIPAMVKELQQHGLNQFKGDPITASSMTNLFAIEFVYSRWKQWGGIFRTLERIPKNGNLEGWTRARFSELHLLHADTGVPYSYNTRQTYARWGTFLWRNRKTLKLPEKEAVPLPEDVPQRPIEAISEDPSAGDRLGPPSSRLRLVEELMGFFRRRSDQLKELSGEALLVRLNEIRREYFSRRIPDFEETKPIEPTTVGLRLMVEKMWEWTGKKNLTLRSYASNVDTVMGRWREWWQHFRALSQMPPMRGRGNGPSREEYAAKNLFQPNGKPYTNGTIRHIIRWGIWVWQNRHQLGLRGGSTMPPPPDLGD